MVRKWTGKQKVNTKQGADHSREQKTRRDLFFYLALLRNTKIYEGFKCLVNDGKTECANSFKMQYSLFQDNILV